MTPGYFLAVLVVELKRAFGVPIPNLRHDFANSVPPTHFQAMTRAQAPITATGGVALNTNLPALHAIRTATRIQIARTRRLPS